MSKAFSSAGYTHGYSVFNVADYLLPHRRNRVYGVALRGTSVQSSTPKAIFDRVHSMKCTQKFRLGRFFLASRARHIQLNQRKNKVLQGVGSHVASRDLVVDLAKSEGRAPTGIGLVPCLTTNSEAYRLRDERVLTGRGKLALMGMTSADFPPLRDAENMPESLLSRLAGNAIALPVLAHILLALLGDGQLLEMVHSNRTSVAIGPGGLTLTGRRRKRCKLPASMEDEVRSLQLLNPALLAGLQRLAGVADTHALVAAALDTSPQGVQPRCEDSIQLHQTYLYPEGSRVSTAQIAKCRLCPAAWVPRFWKRAARSKCIGVMPVKGGVRPT